MSGWYPENPAIWLVPGAGSIFLSPDHGHGNQLRLAQSEVANWKSEVSEHDKNKNKTKTKTSTKTWPFSRFLNSSSYFLKMEFRNK